MRNPATAIGLLIAALACILLPRSTALAQSEDEKNYLRMYFTEEELMVQSATRSSSPVSEVAENITVVTAADIEAMHAHTVAEVLNTVTGVQVLLTGGPGQLAPPSLQGSEQRHVTVLIDGVILNNLSDNVTDLGSIPVQNIEKIEIINGPASSTWGSALGGVVNIITKSGKAGRHGGMLSASLGKRDTGDFRTEASGKQDRLGYYLTAGRLQSHELTPFMHVLNDNVYTKLSYDVTDDTGILFSLGHGRSSRGIGAFADNDLLFGNVFEITHSAFSVNSTLGTGVDLSFSVRTLRQQSVLDSSMLSTGLLVRDNRYIDEGYGSSAKLTLKNSYGTAVFGTDYDNKTLRSNAIAGDEQGLTKWALYANDTFSADKLTVAPGIRFDHTSSNGPVTSPSLGLTYSLPNSTLLRAFVARGYSIPALASTYGDGLFSTANPELKMETVWAYQAGAETAALKYLWIKLTAFRNDVRDAITSQATSTTTFTAVNAGRQRRQGVEVEAKTAPVYHASLAAGAEFIDAKDLDTGDRMSDVPTRVYDLGLLYDDEDTFKALLQGRYIDWNSFPELAGQYGSFVFDLHATKTVLKRKDASLDVFVDGHNIFNGKQYAIFIYKNPEQWFEGGLRYSF